jgi:hypothetical protein
MGALWPTFVRAAVQELRSLDLAGFIDEDAQRLAGTVQAVIEQRREAASRG